MLERDEPLAAVPRCWVGNSEDAFSHNAHISWMFASLHVLIVTATIFVTGRDRDRDRVTKIMAVTVTCHGRDLVCNRL
jgi:hypothetical protein